MLWLLSACCLLQLLSSVWWRKLDLASVVAVVVVVAVLAVLIVAATEAEGVVGAEVLVVVYCKKQYR